MFITTLVTRPTMPVAPVVRVTEQPQMRASKKISRRRYIIALLYALNFAPYAMPPEKRPIVYTDGMTAEEIDKQQQNRRIRRNRRNRRIAKFLYA